MLNRQGKSAIGIASEGHEAAGLGAAWAMNPEKDFFFFYYRDLAGQIALGVTAEEALRGFLAKTGPFSGGRQFPFHGAYPEYRIYNTSNVVGANMTHAVGAALSAKIRNEDSVVICSFGDGGTSQGEWHESLNFAGVHRFDHCVSVRAAKNLPIKHAGHIGVGAIPGAPGHFVSAVVADGRGTYRVKFFIGEDHVWLVFKHSLAPESRYIYSRFGQQQAPSPQSINTLNKSWRILS